MKVLKFGGACLSSPGNFFSVKKIIESQPIGSIIILSALQGVTDQLLQITELAIKGNDDYKKELKKLKDQHINIINEVVTNENREALLKVVDPLLSELDELFQGMYLLHDITDRTNDYILSFGERISAQILSSLVNNAVYIDARDFIKTNNEYGKAKVNFEATNRLFSDRFLHVKKYSIIPGFIGSDMNGYTTTLGRGGADYSAAILAAALNASMLEIWTDMDGFMTADPNIVEKAYAIDTLSYAEAMELSHFGASVIYTPTIQPVYKKNIPISIKNILNPKGTGTLISSNKQFENSSLIKGVSSIEKIHLITLLGAGLVGTTGISRRLFGALAEVNVNIILITQASSEYSISFAVIPADGDKAIEAIKKEFYIEIEQKKEIGVQVEQDLSVIAIVGERMKNTPGISATLFSSLARNGISAIATAQGSSELNISVVINQKSLKKALNSIHEGFFLSHYKDLHLFIVGVGTVGSSLLKQISSQQDKLREDHQLNVRVTGIARSKKMLLDEKGIDLMNYADELEAKGEPANLEKFIEQISIFNLRNSVFIDCTAEEGIAKLYEQVLEKYCSIVTANKIACSSKLDNFKHLHKTANEKGVKFKYETNVGAGLPIISTINDLIRSGDKILALEAVLSGTLNFIFNVLSSETKLSEAVKLAKEKGFSEPDPRVDLSGVDVARKLLILARESGYDIEYDSIKVQPFLPDSCFEGTQEQFWEELNKLDAEFENKRKKLEDDNKRWRFVAQFEKGKASVELIAVDKDHPAYNLEGSNNIILITTERYKEQPMIIKGYGAGAEVTAAGVFADVIRIMNI